MVAKKIYIAIDLKSFFASVECVARGLNPLTTNLVVADEGRTEKTICLAVSPSLKAYGISGRARLFEVVQRVGEVNATRKLRAPRHTFTGESYDAPTLEKQPEMKLGYIIAPPRMSRYMENSTKIYSIYMKYVSPDDIHVYSIDEVFIDATQYLKRYNLSARDFAMLLILDVLNTTGITATAGVGTNLYLAKIAMDILAKRAEPDANGVRIAELDEHSYREKLWEHTPLTDFWRIGRGYFKKLEGCGLHTMGDVARCSLGRPNEFYNEELLYKLFGINAELLIDHAWGYEPVTISEIKAYRPSTNSISTGQVLSTPYDYLSTKLIVREMTELLVLDLVEKRLVTDQIVLSIGYDIENLSDPKRSAAYSGEVVSDHYGRRIPKPTHGSINLDRQTSSTRLIMKAVMELYDRISDRSLTVRRLSIAANHIVSEDSINTKSIEQLDLFTDYEQEARLRAEEEASLQRERNTQEAVLKIKKKYGKNAILKGMNLKEEGTTISRNEQIGGHKA